MTPRALRCNPWRMGNEAFQLQGRNGGDVVGTGQTFTGRSAGFLVANEANLEFEAVLPVGTSNCTLIMPAAPAGFFSGGTIVTLTVTTGDVLVYPESTNYTIV